MVLGLAKNTKAPRIKYPGEGFKHTFSLPLFMVNLPIEVKNKFLKKIIIFSMENHHNVVVGKLKKGSV